MQKQQDMKFGSLLRLGFDVSVNCILYSKHFAVEEIRLISFIS